ncbi:MAG: transporter solute receptor, family [Planctomycetaceae bacterium]|nr:transporter solute receptor, family [Planctomycetaceae bacterium]
MFAGLVYDADVIRTVQAANSKIEKTSKTTMTQASSKSAYPLWIWMALLGICLACLLIPFVLFVEAPPPRHIVIATGRQDGAYYRFAQRYADLLKKEGITLELRATNGSVENLALLQAPNSDISIALVQSGIADPQNSEALQSLCSLYWEPLWIFYNGETGLDKLSQLKGKRLAVGPEGSGTRGIALQMLSANGIDAAQAEFIKTAGNEAAQALINNDVDAAFFVAGVNTTYIQQLLKAPRVHLLELSQAAAYARRFHFLSTVVIPAGGLLELQDNIPAKSTVLISPCATLVAHKSLHPALTALLLNMATKVHGAGDLLTNPGTFPSALHTDLPLSDDAAHYFRFGPPVLQRLLPFWLASLVDRMKIMIIPLIMLLMPLIRATPPLVRWRTRRKIYRWYARLRLIDQRAIQGMSLEEAQQALTELNILEQQVALVGVPLSYMDEYYNLRLHLNLVHSRVLTMVPQNQTAA